MATQVAHVFDEQLVLDPRRDALLTPFGRATLADRYLLPGEGPQNLFARVARAYADDGGHAQRLYDYMSQLWFMPATPILSNGGTERGLPISCFLNAVEDDLGSIVDTWSENVWLASNGGGIGTYWGGVRSIGEPVRGCGHTSGIIPFVRVMDSLTLAISQGSLRRGSAAVYIDVHHPEVEEFIEIRKPSGDFNRKSLNLHHGVCITDEFMHAVRDDAPFALKSPHTGEPLREVSARLLWQRLLETRLQTGEPYLLFVDTANRELAPHQRAAGLMVRQSNLCSEILLPTGRDHLGQTRTAVCCLASVNLERWDEWSRHERFVEDVLRMLDNVLDDFIARAPSSMAAAVYSARRERSVGLGAMGFHSYLQQNGIPFESALARAANLRVFRHLRRAADAASRRLAAERGACPDAADRGVAERFSHKLAIAPTASISVICGGTSACIEPIPANVYTHKTLSGSFSVRNEALRKVLADKSLDTEATWQSILAHEGSVQHLTALTEHERAVFRTAFEIDQRWVVELGGDRAPLLCQGQSLNLYLRSDIHKWDLLMLHWTAWERGIKSLYYCRSKSVQRAGFAGVDGDNTREWRARPLEANADKYDECLACQ
jgi:ribonucleoside-diphosphate reductase alpha chain